VHDGVRQSADVLLCATPTTTTLSSLVHPQEELCGAMGEQGRGSSTDLCFLKLVLPVPQMDAGKGKPVLTPGQNKCMVPETSLLP